MVSIRDVEEARERIKGFIKVTKADAYSRAKGWGFMPKTVWA